LSTYGQDALAITGGSLSVNNTSNLALLSLSGGALWSTSSANQSSIYVQPGSTINNNGVWRDANTYNNNINGAGVFNNNGVYSKTGAGATNISSTFNNTSSGVVNVDAGTLLLDGGGDDDNSIFNSTGNLTFGDGVYSLEGATINASTLSLTGGSLEFNPYSFYNSNNYTLQVNGNLNLSGASLNFNPSPSGTLIPDVVWLGETFDLVNFQGSISGIFNGLAEGSLVTVNGLNVTTWNITYHGGTGNEIELVHEVTPNSVNYVVANANNFAYVAGAQSLVTSTPTTLNLKGLDILPGSSYTLGVYDT